MHIYNIHIAYICLHNIHPSKYLWNPGMVAALGGGGGGGAEAHTDICEVLVFFRD